MVAEDPNVDGFSHHNQGRDLSANETQFIRLIQMGILNGREGYDIPMMASTRAMQHMAAVTMRLWAMLEGEQQRVHSLGVSV